MGSAILDQLDTYGPDRCEALSYEDAAAYTRRLARSHYENFTVVSWLLPRHLRDDFRHVYSFCRWADDLGDETGDPQRSLQLLAWWRRELDVCYEDCPRHPVFVALNRTIHRHDIPREPFDLLIDAFEQDQRIRRYDTWEQVLDYCRRSADPVGRLVLYLCGYRDEQRQQLADATCTALQLANFWQDVRRDILERDRVYIPRDVASAHGLDLSVMVEAVGLSASNDPSCKACGTGRGLPLAGMRAIRPAFRSTMRELVDRTQDLFTRGRGLWPLVEPAVRTDIKLFTLGGEAILRRIRRQDYDTLERRPTLGRLARIGLMLRALLGKLRAGSHRSRGPATA